MGHKRWIKQCFPNFYQQETERDLYLGDTLTDQSQGRRGVEGKVGMHNLG